MALNWAWSNATRNQGAQGHDRPRRAGDSEDEGARPAGRIGRNLGWTKREETDIGRHLHEERTDPYPELSRLALDNEWLLGRLGNEPERLNEYDWELIGETGAEALRLMGDGAESADEHSQTNTNAETSGEE